MYVWICTSLDPERLEGVYSYLAIKILSIPGRCPANFSIPAPRIGTLEMDPKI
jgi:hypothetical protein